MSTYPYEKKYISKRLSFHGPRSLLNVVFCAKAMKKHVIILWNLFLLKFEWKIVTLFDARDIRSCVQ